MRIVILGLSITSSWGNGHATTYRGLVRALTGRGHDVLFLERDVPWYAENRDLPAPQWGRTALYPDFGALQALWAGEVRAADLVVVGSYVPGGAAVAAWLCDTAHGLTAFYDIDTPVTVASLSRGDCAYLTRELLPRFDLYLSFAGGPVLEFLERRYGVQRARPLYCAVDPELYAPEPGEICWDLGYMGTYSQDRQPALERLLCEPARRWPGGRFTVVGPQFPAEIAWPANVARTEHLAPAGHRAFYNQQRFTLNVTRAAMVETGWSPSVRLFEAAACGIPVITDRWAGLSDFFEPGREILVAATADDVLAHLHGLDDTARQALGKAARTRVLAAHTAEHRAVALERYVDEARDGSVG